MAFSLFGKKDRKENNEAEETSLQKRVEELSLDAILPNQFQPRTVLMKIRFKSLLKRFKFMA
ncbi:nucleoid occlusion protein [Listeria fleischmannii subsp. fleischmannii LU2006-1]|nr:nucleoid occlusion protein [Listeria fleischmannii subsp. fleischmannii LU2006-1]